MKRNFQFFMLAVLLAASTLASAQVSIRQSNTSPGMLLTRKDVQDDLKLSADIRKKIAAYWDEILTENGAESHGSGGFVIRSGSGGADMGSQLWKKAQPLLTAAHKTRLEQIRIQTGGARIVLDAAVKPKIGLTADQEFKINSLIGAEQSEVSEKVQSSGGRIDGDLMNEMKAIRKRTDAAIDKMLSKTQKDKLKELGGAPFKPSS